ncbi:hypothetical protein DL93DRAFT_101231 [Clavulina sp. PMI_390]|nr:hypothetical protein DL93DRAFT_101231 [Clavulina sp. PMI_390]
MGGTLTSCACSSSSSSSWSSSSSISSASAGSRLSAEPIRECTFVMMARFVAERSRFIGKPSAGLSGHGISSPSSSTMIAHHQRFASPSPLPASPSTPTPNHFVFSSPAPSSSTPGRKSSSSKLGGAALPKLSLEANFEKLRNASATASASGSSDGLSGNMELGPMVGWPEALGFAADPDADAAMEMEARKKFPVGILPGVSALSYFHAHSIYHPTTAASLRRFNSSSSSTSTSSTMGGGSRAGTPTTPRASSPAISLYRSMTPPPRSSLAAYTSPSPSGNWSGIRLGGSHSAPPHLTNPTTLLARTLATNGPVADAAAATTPTPAKRGWADVVGLHDRERDQMASASSSNAGTPPTTTKEYLRRSGSPTPSPSKRSSMPPSLGRGRLVPLASRMDVGKASPSLAKLDTASSLVSAPAPATPSLASPVHKKSGSMSLTSLNPLAASFAASLSSSLGLAVPEPTPATAVATSSSSAAALDADLASPTSTAILDESDADTTMEMEDVESIASAASTCELVDDASGSSESKAKLPPWARKRVRSTSFAAFSSPSPLASSSSSRHAFRDHAALNSSSSEPVGMGMGMSMSLPSSGLAMHSSIVPSEVIDEEMEDGTTGLIVPVTGTGTDSADAAGLEEEKTPVPTTTTSALSTGFIMDPSVMPPPPIPASLDPTTVTSIPAPSSPPSHFVPLESTTASSSVEMTDDDVEMTEETHSEPSHESEPVAVDAPSASPTAPPPAPVPPAAPAVKMSFLDWKKKRDKAKVVEGDAAPASDSIPAPAPVPTSAPAPVPAPVSAPIFTSDSAPVDTSDTPAAEETSAIDNAPVSLTVPDEQHSAPTEIPEQARDDVDADVDSLPPSESVPVTSSELPLEAPTQPEDVQPESSDLTPLATAITSEPAPIPADIVAPVAEEAIERDVQSTSTLMAPPTPEPVFAADVATQEHEADDDMNMEEETTVEEVQTLPAPATLSPARPYTPSLPVDPLYPDENTSVASPQPIVKLEAVDLALADLSTPTIQPASDALMEDAEDGEILDSPGLSASASSDSPGVGAPTSSLGSVLTRNSRSSTPASVSSRSSPPPQAPSPNIRRPSPGLRERDRPAIRKPPLAPSFGFAPGSPAESNSSVSDRDRDEYRYRAPPSSSSSYPAPPPSSSSYHGNSAGYNPYPPRRGMGYNQGPPRVPNDRWLGQRRGSPPPIIPRERDYDYPPPRPYGNGPPPPPNGWGNRGRPMQHPRRGFGGRGDYQDPSRSPNMRSSPDMNGFNPMGNKGRLPNGPSGPSSSFNRPSNGL